MSAAQSLESTSSTAVVTECFFIPETETYGVRVRYVDVMRRPDLYEQSSGILTSTEPFHVGDVVLVAFTPQVDRRFGVMFWQASISR
jgi:hypothetical protein